MSKLVEVFPILASELVQALRDNGREALALQIEGATIARVSFDPDVDAGWIFLEPSRALNIVEANIIGVRHGETIPLNTRFWTAIDTDNFDRVTAIEILNPSGLKTELMRCAVDDC